MKVQTSVFFSLPFSLFLTSPEKSVLKLKFWYQGSLTDLHSTPSPCHLYTSTLCKSDTASPHYHSLHSRIFEWLSTAFQINSRPLSPDLRLPKAAPCSDLSPLRSLSHQSRSLSASRHLIWYSQPVSHLLMFSLSPDGKTRLLIKVENS